MKEKLKKYGITSFIICILFMSIILIYKITNNEEDAKLINTVVFSQVSYKYSDNSNFYISIELMDINDVAELSKLSDNIVIAECIGISIFNDYVNVYEFKISDQIKGEINTETFDLYINANDANYNIGDTHIMLLGRFDSELYPRTVFTPMSLIINITQMTVSDEYYGKLSKEIRGKSLDVVEKFIYDISKANLPDTLPLEIKDYSDSIDDLVNSSEVIAYITITDIENNNAAASTATIVFNEFFKGKCDVDWMFVPADTKQGDYLVFLCQREENWYRLTTRYDSILSVDESDKIDEYIESIKDVLDV